jgi:exosome complex component CSL4
MMNISSGDFVIPGDVLGVSEEILPGKWTYDDNGIIKASIIGKVTIKQHKIDIIPKNSLMLLEIGDTILGQITDIRGQRAMIDIQCSIKSKRQLSLPYKGAIHISQVKKGYLEKITDAFKIGDIIEGKITKIMGDNLDINTVEDEHGVLKAMCSKCRSYMVPTKENNVFYCEKCDRKEKRKISSKILNSKILKIEN